MDVSSSSFSSYEEALSLDVHLLTILLERNRQQHHRCLYFRRLSMALLALRRCSCNEVGNQILLLRSSAENLLGEFHHPLNKRRKILGKQEQWTLDAQPSDDITLISQQKKLTGLCNAVKNLRSLIICSIPAIESRIFHAAFAIVHELSRVHFVPFLTVALACLSRIRTLLLRMGRDIVLALREFVPQLRDMVSENVKTNSDLNWKALRENICAPFVPHLNSSSRRKSSPSSVSRSSQEWDDVMTQFLEVSHETFFARRTQFVKERRWNDALKNAKLDKCLVLRNRSLKRTNSSNFGPKNSDLVSFKAGFEQNEGLSQILEDDEYDEKDKVTISTSDNGNKEQDDTGELIEACLNPEVASGSSRTESRLIDDNMERVIRMGKERKATTLPTAEKSGPLLKVQSSKRQDPKAKKKKHKKRSKRKSDGMITGFGGNGDECQENKITVQESFFKTETISSILDEQSKYADSPNNNQPANKSMKGVSFEQKTEYSSLKNNNLSQNNRTSENLCLSPSKNLQVGARKEKKKCSKKHRKRRSSNVIDDIFGA